MGSKNKGTIQETTISSTANRICKWEKPPLGWLKCKVDGSWYKESQNSGVGCVLRNHQGQILWLGAKAYPIMNSALDAEIEAFRWTVIMVKNLNYNNNTIFEIDSVQIVKLINGYED